MRGLEAFSEFLCKTQATCLLLLLPLRRLEKYTTNSRTRQNALLQLKIIAAWYSTLEQPCAKNAMWTASFGVHSRSVSNKTERLIENTAEILHKDLCLVFQIGKWTCFLTCLKSCFWMNHSNMREDMILAISFVFNKIIFRDNWASVTTGGDVAILTKTEGEKM